MEKYPETVGSEYSYVLRHDMAVPVAVPVVVPVVFSFRT
jgi:hypothetical protein